MAGTKEGVQDYDNNVTKNEKRLISAMNREIAVRLYAFCLLGVTEKGDALAYVTINELKVLYDMASNDTDIHEYILAFADGRLDGRRIVFQNNVMWFFHKERSIFAISKNEIERRVKAQAEILEKS